MAKIDIYVHGRGRGHATRCLAIAERLQADGHDLRGFAGADASEIVARAMPTTSVDSLPPRFNAHAPLRLLRRVAQVWSSMRLERPDLVVSDGDLPSLLGARTRGVPSVAVGHGLVFAGCECPAHLPAAVWNREARKARASSLTASRRIAVGFVPMRVRATGTVLARATVPVRRHAKADRVVAYFRDGIDVLTLAALRRIAPAADVFGPDERAESIAVDRARFLTSLERARAVIATAGSQLIAECVAWGIPLLAVYDEGDDEQRLNAAMVQSAGFGIGLARHRVDATAMRAFLEHFHVAAPSSWDAPDASEAVARACDELLRGGWT